MTISPSSSSSSSSSSTSSSSITTPIEDLEWEEWDPHTSPLSFYHHCLAGSFAGVAEHTLLYPLDTVKTCWQSRVLHRAGGAVGGGSPNSLCPPCSFHPNNSIPSVAKSEEGIWSTMKHLMHHHPHHPTTAATATAASTTGRNPASFQHHPHHGRSHPSHQRGVYTLARLSVEASSSTWKVSNGNHRGGAIATEELRKKQKRPWSHRARSAASASALSFEGAASATSSSLSLTSPSSSTPSAAGVKRLWRGVQTMFIGCVPAHALYFSSYELVKKLSNRSNGHYDFDSNSNSNSHHDSTSHSAYENTLAPAQAMLAGGLATLLHDSIMTPMDTIKQRMQLGHYRNVRHALSSIVVGGGGEGWRGLYRSFPVTVATNVPYGMIVVTVNERLRGALEEGLYGGTDTEPRKDDDDPDRPFHFLTVLLSGMGAGTVAAAATAPLDRVKTRLQTQRMGLVVAGTETVAGGKAPSEGVKAIAEERALAASRGEVRACPKMVAREVKEALFASSGWSSNSSTVTGNNITHITQNQNHHHHHPPNHNPFHKTYYTTPREAFRSIVQEEGYRGLFRGTLPRVALHAPSVAISWTAYEMAKGWLLCFGGSTE